ncbi:EF-hand domain-containing family member B-like [Harmonia axyridis]|uniref:EF-hand domain-containing family member B-like n=1 Tax=Harmonia axyridis TaxID=115357 RepID=UPI001E275726|nr:EF-hand domain-containing family member B-like [Harmonia axyridis]
MANAGKYKDNYSFICAAGVKGKPNYTVGDTFKRYTLEDEVQALKADLHVSDKKYEPVKFPKVPATTRNPGIFIESREVLKPPPQTRYRQLVNDLKETTYESYWNKQIGKTRDSTASFPEGMKVDEITFGDAYNYDTTAKELIQPPKTRYQVLWDSQINHDNYKRIYGSYNPGERIVRGYKSPPYRSSQAFGKYCGYDKRGLKAKCCLEWYNTTPISIASEIQSKWNDQHHQLLGRCHQPNHSLRNLPKDQTFGRPYKKEMYGMEELLKDSNIPISTAVRDIRSWLVSWNRLKMAMDEKISPTFDHNILYEKLKHFDLDGSGFVSFGNFLQLMRCYEIFFNIKNVSALMGYLGMIIGDRVDYSKFVEALKEGLTLEKIRIPGNDLHLISTYQAACCDLVLPDANMCRRDAGIPTHRFDEVKPANPYTARYENLSDYTDMKACLQPSIATQYCVSHRDYLRPRDEEFLRSLFRKIGYDLSDEIFSKIWQIGRCRDRSTDGVSVQTFRDVLNELISPLKKLNVDEVSGMR